LKQITVVMTTKISKGHGRIPGSDAFLQQNGALALQNWVGVTPCEAAVLLPLHAYAAMRWQHLKNKWARQI
jgi:hypothetical protein